MTRRRKQKRHIRERMARTGESYSTARAQLLRRAHTTLVGSPVVMIPVTQMPRAIAFYRDALGFPLLGNNIDESWAEVGDASITFALHAGAATGVQTGVGILVQDIDATCRAVVAHGGRFAQGSLADDRVVTMQDPDGNFIQLMKGGASIRP